MKEEEYSDEEALASEGSAYEHNETHAPSRPRRKSAMMAKSYIESDGEPSDGFDDDDQLLIGAEVSF